MIPVTMIPVTMIPATVTPVTMTAIMTNLLTPSAMQSLGWALLHFLWQGTALAALAAAAMAVCRRASVRYALGVSTLVLMLLAPLATGFFYSRQFNSQQS